MDIRLLYYFIYISCVFISHLNAKPFSLNEIIAAEQQVAQSPENIFEPSEYTKIHSSPIRKTSPLRYKKAFKIKSPSKPKKLKHLQRPRNKRKKLTSKREISQNEKTVPKYIPLLRNIGMFFDNILSSGSSEVYNTRTYEEKQINFDESNDRCTCNSNKYDSKYRSRPQKKTFTAFTTPEVEVETLTSVITSTTPTRNSANDNISSFGWDTNIPLLLARNTSSLWRNNNRFDERSGSSYNGSLEGYISGVHRNNEYITNDRKGESDTQYYEKNSYSYSRDNTSSYGPTGGIRRIRTDPRNPKDNRRTDNTEESVLASNETSENVTRDLPEHEREIKFEIRRNETKSPIFLPKFASRLRQYGPQEKNTSIRTTESSEKSFTYDYASNKRVSGRNGSNTEKNQENSGTDEARTLLNSISNTSLPVGKVVMIFDGYSVARDVNGENKRKEKAIHIHS